VVGLDENAQDRGAAHPFSPLAACQNVTLREGYEASLLLVDGNPLEDTTGAERISIIFFKGERVARAALFED
jgi:hypothetical protein